MRGNRRAARQAAAAVNAMNVPQCNAARRAMAWRRLDVRRWTLTPWVVGCCSACAPHRRRCSLHASAAHDAGWQTTPIRAGSTEAPAAGAYVSAGSASARASPPRARAASHLALRTACWHSAARARGPWDRRKGDASACGHTAAHLSRCHRAAECGSAAARVHAVQPAPRPQTRWHARRVARSSSLPLAFKPAPYCYSTADEHDSWPSRR